MEVTLEKIELVKDRTGVSYREAKDALEAADGSVVDAIIAIEETIDENGGRGMNGAAGTVVDVVRNLVQKGNIARISVKRNDEILVNVPVNAGIIGTLIAPWGVIAGIVAAFGFRCRIELTRDDGSVINISQRAATLGRAVTEKGSVVVEDVVSKGSAVFEGAVEKGSEAYNNIKDAASDRISNIRSKKDDIFADVEEKAEDLGSNIAGVWETAEEKVAEKVGQTCEKVEEACEKIGKKAEE